jgi:hypothetical protein
MCRPENSYSMFMFIFLVNYYIIEYNPFNYLHCSSKTLAVTFDIWPQIRYTLHWATAPHLAAISCLLHVTRNTTRAGLKLMCDFIMYGWSSTITIRGKYIPQATSVTYQRINDLRVSCINCCDSAVQDIWIIHCFRNWPPHRKRMTTLIHGAYDDV